MRARIRSMSALLVALFSIALLGSAQAHAALVSATPAADSTLATAPATVTLVFSQELTATGNLITVNDAAGAQADQGDTTLATSDPQRQTLTVSLKSGLADGRYTVRWKNSSTDGHAEEGSYSFTIGAASAPAAAPALPATGAGDSAPISLLAVGLLLALAGLTLRRRAAR